MGNRMSLPRRITLATIMAATLALLAYSRIGKPESSYIAERQTATPAVESGGGETATDSIQRQEDAVVSGVGPPMPRAPRATRGSSSAKGDRLAGSHPASADQPGLETAGPPIFYMDQADDAYGPDSPPNAALSQREFDILRVDWGPVSYVSEESPGGYSTSITVGGTARADAWYVSFGRFRSCDLYHALAPGITAFSYDACSQGKVVQGSPVTTTQTAAGGTVLSATFDNRAIPPWLQAAGRTLHNLSAMTCIHKGDGRLDCASQYDVLDKAISNQTYRL